MDGFKRPIRQESPPSEPPNQPQPRPVRPETATPTSSSTEVPPPGTSSPHGSDIKRTPQNHRKRLMRVGIALLLVLILVGAGSYSWYRRQLTPVDANSSVTQQFVVKDGELFDDVANRLKDQGLIRSVSAFDIAARLNGQRAALKAGTCSLTSALSSPDILAKLVEGCQDFKSITFYPGATIEKPFYKSPSATLSQTLYVKNVLREAGYSDEAIEQGLNASYDSPLFAGKPEDTTLEGYIYGETYFVATDASVESVLRVAFDEMYKVVEAHNLPQAYKEQGLATLYDGITMASIVQRELNCEDKPTPERKDRCYGYQQTIAQVLLKRLRERIPLGADVTFIYAADMAGEPPTINFDSPYNTRINKGLPPGPIGTPGELALRAVANPSETDYLYFVAGDDGLIYFSKTQAEHERNTREHCKKLCFELN